MCSCGRDLLVTKHEHVVVQVRAVDAREVFGVDRFRDVEPDDFSAHRGVEGAHLEVLRRGFKGLGVGKNGSHAANVGAAAPFSNELFVASL
jgi:hypothetical protein